ncbi:MAG: 30S ribosomal protein S20 [Chloroflexota bacterium]|nr:30S ribosomal protein S20 [Dehalococcoidia bacterium]MDW8254062.1 30S ribosomal protein S20 [Chloroflexota bacterium]
MPNTKSAAKAMRRAERRRAINKPIRTRTRTAVKEARLAIETGNANAQEAVLKAVSALDRAAFKGVIHKNAAARRKSRLMRRLHQLQRAAAASSASAAAAPAAEAAPPPQKGKAKKR